MHVTTDVSPRRSRLFDGLVVYYGLWQVGHMLFNVVAAATGTDSARAVLGDGMSDEEWRTVIVSGYVDFFFASPVGVAFAVGWRRGRAWALTAGAASITAALSTAIFVYWLQFVFVGRLQLDALGAAGLATFVPVLVLAALLPGQLRSSAAAG